MATTFTSSSNTENHSDSTSSDTIRQVMVIVALISTVVINTLSNALPINGVTPAEISDSFPVRFTPAGFVFSIWSVIYLGLLVYAIYQALPSQRSNPRLRMIGWPFVLTCLANSFWIFAWHYGFFTLSLGLMLVLLGGLIAIYVRLLPAYPSVTSGERWSTHIPFRIYLGWITVATIANATIVLYDQGWRGAPLDAPMWAAIMITVATLVGLIFALKVGDVTYTLVLVWAFFGIYVRQIDAPVVAYTAAGLAILLVLAALYAFGKQWQAGKSLVIED